MFKCLSKVKRAQAVGKVGKEKLLTVLSKVTSNLLGYLEQFEQLKKEKLPEHLHLKLKDFAGRVKGKNIFKFSS